MSFLHPRRASLDELEDEKRGKAENVEDCSNITCIDDIQVLGLAPDDAEFYRNFDTKKKKRVDVRLVPMLSVLYLVSHLDRANIGNAKIAGLTEDLGLSGIQYNIALSLFFIPYVLLGESKPGTFLSTDLQANLEPEVPSNILLKTFTRPSHYLGILTVSWGIIMTLTGVVQNFGGLLAVRILLGIFEAGFFPGAVYLCSLWYMPRDLATRISLFYCASALSGAFSGLLAAGIAKMDGVGGYEGWRWIFLLEGLLTVILGVLCFFFLIDSPNLSGKWLDNDEIRYLELQHFIKEGGKFKEEQKRTSWGDIRAVMLNWRMNKIYTPYHHERNGIRRHKCTTYDSSSLRCWCHIRSLFSTLSDRFYWRMPFVVVPLLLIVTGYSIIMGLKGQLQAHIGPGFFAIILTCMGIYPTHPATTSWTMNNLAPSNRRAIGSAFNICVGNIGGIIGSYMYLDREGPTYPTGFGLSLAFGGSALVAALILEVSFVYANKRNGMMTESEIRDTYSDEQLLDMGDKSPLFKYTL
ncbi:hypothetical protein N7499_001393 [Penicillium canescens]|uniref:uncharacterized protein n=1 Tax=Penicillium canescens TaxID=5083 RepID=UPI0026DFA999|nr:uncharacterized protein N7446_003467 [Penicillium canescens]KAJ6066430.1 hypothetical protein N7446_003467 [Penicillium canescens]KAJ6101763.1 hypothetical protein N7499_001393 [Penicillium canescens]